MHSIAHKTVTHVCVRACVQANRRVACADEARCRLQEQLELLQKEGTHPGRARRWLLWSSMKRLHDVVCGLLWQWCGGLE